MSGQYEYDVEVIEHNTAKYRVSADSPEEAFQKIKLGLGEYVDSSAKFKCVEPYQSYEPRLVKPVSK